MLGGVTTLNYLDVFVVKGYLCFIRFVFFDTRMMNMDAMKIRDDERILILAPHPDDESIGLGGLLIKYGKNCDVWVMTDGSRCQTILSEEEITIVRTKELYNAMLKTKVRNYRVFDIKDKTLALSDTVLDFEDLNIYSKIFIPSDNEKHIDHLATSVIAIEALKKNKIQADVFFYEITSPMSDFNTVLDITDVIEEKKELINIYKSQIEVFDYVNAACYLNGFRACMLKKRNSYVEVFKHIDATKLNNDKEQLIVDKEKNQIIINILKEWIKVSGCGEVIAKKLSIRGIKSIDIYGYGQLGELFCDVIKNENKIIVDKILDRRFFNIDEYASNVDAVIITIIGDSTGVKETLMTKGAKKIYTLLDLINMEENGNEMGK